MWGKKFGKGEEGLKWEVGSWKFWTGDRRRETVLWSGDGRWNVGWEAEEVGKWEVGSFGRETGDGRQGTGGKLEVWTEDGRQETEGRFELGSGKLEVLDEGKGRWGNSGF
ncbi:hypothetical protein [Rhodonellum sp.]|uniref:hypothetical protein n=1 Tax=Rhodonellum sp. TaxID=2231180 RepID=UPI00271637E8|nr:hypothetical protein [Rhodonellum sp.]MDO9554340.1 hypothetical protein [Rhodonellum sp.]